jgi:hypothetical protein
VKKASNRLSMEPFDLQGQAGCTHREHAIRLPISLILAAWPAGPDRYHGLGDSIRE